MQENNNTTNLKTEEPSEIIDQKDPKSLASATDTKEGTNEFSALKAVHRGYNQLNGFDAMLHIISRFRLVLIPFIALSVAGSSYSFFNDFVKAFPMLSDTFTIALAIFFSIMLEIVRDGAIIALFNSKMNKLSRSLVIVIFLATTSYMFSSHYKAVKVIEESAVKYALEHQTQESKTATNPRYEVANNALKGLEQDLKNKELEKTPQLIENSNSIHAQKRADAMNRIDKIDAKIERLKSEIEAKNNEIIQYEDENKQETEDSQKIISSILLATLFLVESLAMLGAVIKFIYKDNAQKEIAKHSEIVEEYVNISEQMKRDNESLVKNLGQAIKTQSQSNQNIMGLVVGDLQQSSHQNIQFIQAVATLKNQMVAQMNEIVIQVAQSNQIAPTAGTSSKPMMAQYEEHEEPKPKERKIGFQANNQKELVMRLWDNGKIKAGDKLVSKSHIIDVNDRSEDKKYKEIMKNFTDNQVVKFNVGHGYYALGGLDVALRAL